MIVTMHARKEGEPGIQNHVTNVCPYTRVGSVANHEYCAWARTTFEPSGSMRVRRKTTRVSAGVERMSNAGVRYIEHSIIASSSIRNHSSGLETTK